MFKTSVLATAELSHWFLECHGW